MSFFSKLTAVAVVVLGVRALQGTGIAKAPVKGSATRKAAKAARSSRKIAAKRAMALAADSNGAPKARSGKRIERGAHAKRTQT